MEYVALLRGINVGGKNKVVMGELRRQVEDMGCANVRSYINSGNVLFETDVPESEISRAFAAMLKERYPFPIRLAILSREDYLSEVPDLPTWWSEPIARRDVLFFTREMDAQHARRRIKSMPLGDEAIHFGRHVVFWGKFTESEYLRTAYHRLLMREDFYPLLTIRSGNTFDAIATLLTRS